ncbi:hypothetical protein [Aquimarina mytili]|nr:hypothetical protein [Aquimarina mytili]
MKISTKMIWIMVIAAAITIIGLITGWYLFILVIFPLGLLFSKKK